MGSLDGEHFYWLSKAHNPQGRSVTHPFLCWDRDDLQELSMLSSWETVKHVLMMVVYQFPETWT